MPYRFPPRWLAFSLALVCCAAARAGGRAADLARQIRENSFDPQECYRVRDLHLEKEDIRIYLTDGHLIFSKPVAGRRYAAIFTADVEGGDGEVILLPPNRAERSSLASYTGSPNLDEHFRSVLLFFTGDDYAALKAQMPSTPGNRLAPELGATMAEQWNSVLRNVGASYQTRLTLDLLGSPGFTSGLLVGVFNGIKDGNFDLLYDPQSPEQILGGQVSNRDARLYFDIWVSFVARSFRDAPARSAQRFALSNFRIDSTLAPDLTLNCITRVTVKPLVDGITVTPFEIASQMSVSAATVDGRPAEVFDAESLRSNLNRGGNHLFLVVPPEPLHAGRQYEFEFHHAGKVIEDAGDRVFYVAARGNWYPAYGVQYATFDLLFRVPRDLDLVSAGQLIEDRIDGDTRIIRRRTAVTIRMAGFNLGNYKHARIQHGGYSVDVCANRSLEQALQPATVVAPPPPLPIGRRRPADAPLTAAPPPPPDPLGRLASLANDVASAMDFMTARFGPPALPYLTVSPIPGTFGQGFPGLLYLSTLSYLRNPGRSANINAAQEIFFADLLQAHEVAHQWWGNRVAAATYRDNWLMEALANYSALLFLEKTKGERTMEMMLDSYREQLLATGESGRTVESAGPIVLGSRLENSVEPRAWHAITYGKGSWLIHMLRRQMGDERFFAMLAALAKRYDHQTVSTEQFRQLAAEFLPPKSDDPHLETFFDQWVYGTGIPGLKLSYSLTGKAPAAKVSGILTQTGVDDDFTALVPVDIQLARGSTITRWIRSSSDPVRFTVPVGQVPLKVTLDPHHNVLRR